MNVHPGNLISLTRNRTIYEGPRLVDDTRQRTSAAYSQIGVVNQNQIVLVLSIKKIIKNFELMVFTGVNCGWIEIVDFNELVKIA